MKYIISLIITLWSIMAWGQEGGFNPSNPQEPGQIYSLTVTVSPEGAGSTSSAGKKQYALGQEIILYAYANAGYRFTGWKQGEKILSDQSSFPYVIPAEHTVITALFEYHPGDPAEPGPVPLRHKLFLDASPAEGGSFNITSGTWVKEGESINLQAYLNSGYEFVGWKQGDKTVSTDGAYSFAMGTEDLSLTAMFRFNPANPGNPGANRWNATTGELIIDDFQPGNIMSAIDAVIGGSGNREKVTMVIVSGQMSPYDFGISSYLQNCTLLDLSRTRGYDKIPDYAFNNSNLTSVILPAIVEQIGNYAFLNCKNLTDISCYSVTPPTLGYNVFDGINEGVVLHVLSSAISLYSEAEGWKELTILPLTEEVRTLEVKLPVGSEGNYKNMTLELVNKETGQKQKYVVSDRSSYTFNGLLKNCEYSVTMKTPTGSELGKIDGIKIEDDNVSVAFASLLSLQEVNVKIQTPDGTDVTEQIRITWLSGDKTYLAQGRSLKGLIIGVTVNYQVELNGTLGTQFVVPVMEQYTVTESDNSIVVILRPIAQVFVTGVVKDETGKFVSDAVISFSQILNGKNPKTITSKSDKEGVYKSMVYNDSTIITISYPNCLQQTIICPDFSGGGDMGTTILVPIKGSTITLQLTYTSSVLPGEIPVKKQGYPDFQNVMYMLENATQKRAITKFSIQYPNLVLLDIADAMAGDQLHVKAVSLTNQFDTVKCNVIIDSDLKAIAQLDIVQFGVIQMGYTASENLANVAIIYDQNGKFVKRYNYAANQILTTDGLDNGTYRVVSMASSNFFNSILNIEELVTSGLSAGVDYVVSETTVQSGRITQMQLQAIPKLNESKLYYTGIGTAFTVNKQSATVGSYLTLRGAIDFKPEFGEKINDVKLIVDLPNYCEFILNSVIVGNSIATSYDFKQNQLIVPLVNYAETIRFCVIPTKGGVFTPNAFVEFTLDGKSVCQPIGAALFNATDFYLNVPEKSTHRSIPISGLTTANSMVTVYDNDVVVGIVKSLANGSWSLSIDLHNPYSYSLHDIRAEVVTPTGFILTSSTKQLDYNANGVEVSKVSMINMAHPAISLDICEYMTVFDYLNPVDRSPVYWYWPNYPEFTFLVEFTKNDTAFVKNVVLNVFTSSGNIVPLETVFEPIKKIWIAKGNFDSGNLPKNVGINFYDFTIPEFEFTSDFGRNKKLLLNTKASASQHEIDIENLCSRVDALCEGALPNKEGVKDELRTIGSTMWDNDDPPGGIGHNSLERRINYWRGRISAAERKCNGGPDPDPKPSPSPDADPIVDPSGYVYEAVETNRLQGVTATCYYKEMVEDMYGDLHENIVLWDAAEYAQENPLFTDQDGMYAWDVPQGLWQVKFEKEGYQTTYSEWLPVPPPQLEVNIGMIQSTQPTVDAVRGFDTGIEVDFSKFMQPATLTTDQIKITRNGAAVGGEIVMKNEEIDPQNPGQKFASRIRFIPAEPLATDNKVVLTISKRVKSYAGIQMENDYSQEIDIVKEPKAIAVSSLDVVYNKTAEITVTVEPAESVKGKKMIATSASPMIASIVPAELLLDESGKATFTITGELLGQTMLRFKVEGMALRSEVTVRVINASEEEFTHNYQLSMGWNWLSVHVLDPNLKDAATLFEPIKESVLTVRGETGELTNTEEEGWQGTLTALKPEQAYKIKVKQDVGLALKGKAIDLSKTTITLRKGWNWIGYLSAQTLPLDVALRNLVAEENDVIKGLDCFAIYDGTRWIGNLTNLLSGEGYVYYSQSVKSFNYTETSMASHEEAVSAQWEYDTHRYADNMTVLARVYMGEQPVEAGRYVMGAFVGKECRGVAVEKDGYWFLSIHGEESGEKINLRAFDTNTNEEHLIEESLEFGGTMKGSPVAPVSLHVGGLTGIESLTSGIILYPNPVRERLYIRGDIGSMREIHIMNANGKVCLAGGSLSVENGIDVSPLQKGVYFITIKTDHDVIQQKFIKM